jgi:serine/threonine protein kinase
MCEVMFENNNIIIKHIDNEVHKIYKVDTNEKEKSICNIIKKIDSPHLVKIVDVRHNYIIFEKYDCDLFNMLVKRLITKDKKLNYILQIVCGLEVLHNNNIIHGDVKPENILIRRDKLVLTDFGSSIKVTDGYKKSMSTDGYCAPEFFENIFSGFKFDIFSLGVTIFAILTENLLFKSSSDYNNRCWYWCSIKCNHSKHVCFEYYIKRFSKHKTFNSLLMNMLKEDPNERPNISTIKKEILFHIV